MGLKFLDLFAGIGGFRLGMEATGHECVGYVEWDKFARKSYEAIHNTEGEWSADDIREVSDDDLRRFRGTVDVICGGFPCQAFSIAGKRQGFEDTRGTLFFEIARFANVIRPKYLFLENVKGLLDHDGGNTFRTILESLHELGYDAEWQVINSKDFGGVAQSRERVFIIGHLRGSAGRKVFPISGTTRTVGVPIKRVAHANNFRRYWQTYSLNSSIECMDTMQGGGRQPCVMLQDGRIRKLTPRETWRLQSFPDWAFNKAAEVNSDSQLYKQAGNSVTVNVIKAIAERLTK